MGQLVIKKPALKQREKEFGGECAVNSGGKPLHVNGRAVFHLQLVDKTKKASPPGECAVAIHLIIIFGPQCSIIPFGLQWICCIVR